jgi:phosphate uptake regulator
MAAASERIVVQVTPLEKRAIVNTAKRLGLNVSELVRQAAQGFTPPSDEKEMEQLVARVNASTLEASRALDDARIFIEASNKRMAKLTKRKP